MPFCSTIISFARVLAPALLIAIVVSCGGSSQSESKEESSSEKNTVKTEGPNRVAREFAAAVSARDFPACMALSVGFIHNIFVAFNDIQRGTSDLVRIIREYLPVESAKHLALRKIERTVPNMIDQLWMDFRVDGLLKQDLEAGQNEYQIIFGQRRGGEYSERMTVIRGDNGDWRVSMIQGASMKGGFLSAIRNEATKATCIVPSLKARLEKEQPKTVAKALAIAGRIQIERNTPEDLDSK